ncbi:PBIP1 protein, partial [Penelope pileata]|nr:PBIP1 protein [Penelope pileata]
PCPQGLEEHLDPGADTEPTPGGPTERSAAQSWEQEEPDTERASPPGTHTAPSAPPGPLPEEGSCTSSDDDVEGLRRRHGHEPRAGGPPPTPPPRRGLQDEGDEDGLSMNKVLLGAAVLLAVALLIVSGELGGSPAPSTPRAEYSPPQDSAQSPPLPGTEDPRSVQSVSALLDKLAKENHDIRLMQAELQVGARHRAGGAAPPVPPPCSQPPGAPQAHKEELQALLQQSEGAAEAQRQSLAAENAELRAALQREGDALRAARAELQHLRAEGGGSSPQPPLREAKQPHGAAHQEEAQRHSSTR